MLIEVPYSYVARYRLVAAKDRVSVSDTAGTRWFRMPAHEGFAGLLESGQVLRIKGVFIHPEFRGLGYGTQLTEALIAEAAQTPQKRLEVLAYNAAFYESRGFTRKTQLRNGAWRLVKE